METKPNRQADDPRLVCLFEAKGRNSHYLQLCRHIFSPQKWIRAPNEPRRLPQTLVRGSVWRVNGRSQREERFMVKAAILWEKRHFGCTVRAGLRARGMHHVTLSAAATTGNLL